MARLVNRLLATSSWAESRVLLRRYPRLLDEDTDRYLMAAAWDADRAGDHEDAAVYRFHQELVRRCRQVGVDRALTEQRRTWRQVSSLAAAGVAAYRRYRSASSAGELTAAVVTFERALALAIPGHPDRSGLLSNLGLALLDQYFRDPRQPDLDRCVALLKRSLAEARERTDRYAPLANLGLVLLTRRRFSSTEDDLGRAAEILREAIDLADDTAERGRHLSNLGIALADRYARTGEVAELKAAVDAYESAVRATGVTSPDYPGQAANLGTGLAERFFRLGDPGDLDRAVELMAYAIDATTDRADLIDWTENLALLLRDRFLRDGQLTDLDDAVTRLAHATSTADRCAVLTNLGSGLLDRSDVTGDPADLDEAILILTAAVDDTDQRSPDLPARLNNLGNGLSRRFDRDGSTADVDDAMIAYREGYRLGRDISVEAGLHCALNWGHRAGRLRLWDQAAQAYDGARRSADRLIGQHLVRRDTEVWLATIGDLPVQAAYGCGRTGALDAAVTWLEWGRARVVSDVLERDRADLARLAAHRSDLAGRYRAAAVQAGALQVRHLPAQPRARIPMARDATPSG